MNVVDVEYCAHTKSISPIAPKSWRDVSGCVICRYELVKPRSEVDDVIMADSVREFIRKASLEQLTCRTFRHAWNVEGGVVEASTGGTLTWTLPCLRSCGTYKTLTITLSGRVIRTSYQWQDSYHVKGGLDRADLNRIRQVLLDELGGE